MHKTNESLSVVYIEDDEKLGRLTSRYLEQHGVLVTLTTDPRDGIAAVIKLRPDVVLLDLMLPGIHGLEVCRRLRERVDIPILMVTALGEEADRVMGLEGGADDYVAKPFSARELLARIRAHARRVRGRTNPSSSIVAGRFSIDTVTRHATLDGQTLPLTTYEFDLLRVFVTRADQVLDRERLIELVKGNAEEAFDRSIDRHISNLRKKLGDDPKRPQLLKTVRSVGYLLSAGGR